MIINEIRGIWRTGLGDGVGSVQGEALGKHWLNCNASATVGFAPQEIIPKSQVLVALQEAADIRDRSHNGNRGNGARIANAGAARINSTTRAAQVPIGKPICRIASVRRQRLAHDGEGGHTLRYRRDFHAFTSGDINERGRTDLNSTRRPWCRGKVIHLIDSRVLHAVARRLGPTASLNRSGKSRDPRAKTNT